MLTKVRQRNMHRALCIGDIMANKYRGCGACPTLSLTELSQEEIIIMQMIIKNTLTLEPWSEIVSQVHTSGGLFKVDAQTPLLLKTVRAADCAPCWTFFKYSGRHCTTLVLWES